MLEDGEVMGGVPVPATHLVVGEGDVHAPMQAVFDAPVGADRLRQAPCIRRQAAEMSDGVIRAIALPALARSPIATYNVYK